MNRRTVCWGSPNVRPTSRRPSLASGSELRVIERTRSYRGQRSCVLPSKKKKSCPLSVLCACRQTRVIFTRLVKAITSPRCCLYPLCFLCVCKPSFPPYFVILFYFTYLQKALAAPTHVACAFVLSVGLLHCLWLCVSLSGLSTRQ